MDIALALVHLRVTTCFWTFFFSQAVLKQNYVFFTVWISFVSRKEQQQNTKEKIMYT